MQTIYRINANELDQNFLEGLKATFRDKEIEIIVSEVDETAYLMASPANQEKLLQAVENINSQQNLVEVSLDSL
ncbi:hypothetical protein [Planktothrix mougeotii]|uniref:Uncharacterized protein n=1 Tax=Planktothrix mougeotii LEGE 06226 TaxID=1828728 RepID=A0ABR9UDV3_9CYAN|nr:hypothetical protein [Planktothrix mougeotii]MBE9144640.1 hypothetical protein [Planktothrix mougeotii LEGE 06226]